MQNNSKKILIILGHPDLDSYNYALFNAYKKGALASGAEVRELIIYLQEELNLERMSMYNKVKSVEYDFYHSEIDSYCEIKKSSEVALQVVRFTSDLLYGNSRKFAETAPFFRGCIRVSWNNKAMNGDGNCKNDT